MTLTRIWTCDGCGREVELWENGHYDITAYSGKAKIDDALDDLDFCSLKCLGKWCTEHGDEAQYQGD